MKKYITIFLICTSLHRASGKDKEQVSLTPNQIESIFFKQNLELIAESMNISIAQASITQAKLWDNPTLSVGDMNLWSTTTQRNGEATIIPPLFGSFARNTQFSIELSQMIQTAGKRSKYVSIEKSGKEISTIQFEELLRLLKTELRKTINEMIYINASLDITKMQYDTLNDLIRKYDVQLALGNFSKRELMRLQAALLDIEQEMNTLCIDANNKEKILKALLCCNSNTTIIIQTETDLVLPNPNKYTPSSLIKEAILSRPDYKLVDLEIERSNKTIKYEKAMRVPDVTVSTSYDRAGGVWNNFIGFGVSMDIPLLNRNQGNIKKAQIEKHQKEIIKQNLQLSIEHEVIEAYDNYCLFYNFYKKTKDNPIIEELDTMQKIYTKNLLDKNISMLEFIDFLDTYKSNKQAWFTAKLNVSNQLEELRYIIGNDLNQSDKNENNN